MYLSCPVWFAAFKRWPHIRQKCAVAGLLINAVAIAAASFATEVSHLILTQGVLYAIGGVMVYCPACAFLDEWFIRRKGLAFGVMWVSSSCVFSNIISAKAFGPCTGRYWCRWSCTSIRNVKHAQRLRLSQNAPCVCYSLDIASTSTAIFCEASDSCIPNISSPPPGPKVPCQYHILDPSVVQHSSRVRLFYS